MKLGPNILITGTPGVGKSTLATLVADKTGLEYVNVSQVAAENNCFDGYDDERGCPILDEEKDLILDQNIWILGQNRMMYRMDEGDNPRIIRLANQILDELEDPIKEGDKIVDYHSCDFFPERFFDIVFVLRIDNTILYDRLTARGYSGKKLEDNMECEIMAVIRDEALESYEDNIVHELPSNTTDDMERNAEQIIEWIKAWKRDNLNIMN